MKLQLTKNQTLTFYDDESPVSITIIRSGFPGQYIFVTEDPVDGAEIVGTLQTKADIESRLEIKLNDYWEDAQ